MNAFSGKIWVIIFNLILLVQTGCTGIRPRNYSEGENVGAGKNIESLQSIIQEQGFLNTEIIQKKWGQHQDGTHDWSHSLWSVYMFQLWMIENTS